MKILRSIFAPSEFFSKVKRKRFENGHLEFETDLKWI